MSDARDEIIASLRSDLVIARGRAEEMKLNLARVLRETDASLTTAYADRDRFDHEAMDLRSAVREYLAADAHRDEMVAVWLEVGEHDTDVNAALAAARTRYDDARRALVAIDGGAP